jgi:hypothetical protein
MSAKTERLSVKVLQADKMALEQMAKADGESMAVIVRRLIREAAKERGLSPTNPGLSHPGEGDLPTDGRRT